MVGCHCMFRIGSCDRCSCAANHPGRLHQFRFTNRQLRIGQRWAWSVPVPRAEGEMPMKQHFSIVSVVFLALAASCQMLAQAGNAQPRSSEPESQFSRTADGTTAQPIRASEEVSRSSSPTASSRAFRRRPKFSEARDAGGREIEGEPGQGLPNRGLGPSRAGAKTQALPLSAAGDHGQGLIPVFSSHSGFLTFQEHVQSRFDGSTII